MSMHFWPCRAVDCNSQVHRDQRVQWGVKESLGLQVQMLEACTPSGDDHAASAETVRESIQEGWVAVITMRLEEPVTTSVCQTPHNTDLHNPVPWTRAVESLEELKSEHQE